jgi:hypothetical protein
MFPVSREPLEMQNSDLHKFDQYSVVDHKFDQYSVVDFCKNSLQINNFEIQKKDLNR